MDFYLMGEDNQTLRLPVNPEEVTVMGEKQIETVNILRLGEVDFPTGDKRAEIHFASFFPAHYDPGYCRYADIPDPQQALAQLLSFRDSGKPVRLLITDSPINTLVLIVRVNYTLRGGEPGDIYYEVTARTWREVAGNKTTAPSSGAPAGQPRPSTKPKPKTYTVNLGDNLWIIAKRTLGDGSRWMEIYNANKKLIGPDPDSLKPGMELVIP
ncbi:MAG: LysM peptidoglycan-binding domain-containing protein [Limnochordales bacterium]|nr:LysM peptidoglycan-binding domain-containing protein [Limnochordales bacterium]